MENSVISKHTISYGLSLAITSVLNAILVATKETHPYVMDAMRRITSHHWITHSVLMVLLFVGLGWCLAQANGGRGVCITAQRLLRTVVTGVIFGSLTIVAYYWISG